MFNRPPQEKKLTTQWIQPHQESAVTLPRGSNAIPSQEFYHQQQQFNYNQQQMHQFNDYNHYQMNYPRNDGFPPAVDHFPSYPQRQHTAPQSARHEDTNSTVPLNEKELAIFDNSPEKPRFIYCCIPYNKRRRNICLLTTLIILAVLGIVAYLFFPRFPQMKVLNLNLSNGVRSFHISGLENGPTKDFSVQLDMWMSVSVLNTNFYHMKLENIDLQAFIMANVTQLNKGSGAAAIVPGSSPKVTFTPEQSSVPIGVGNHTALVFPSNQMVNFTMNFTVLYRPNPNIKELKDDVMLNEIFQSCNIIQPGNRTMVVRYKAKAPVALLQPIGLVPTFEDELKINCPFPPDQLGTLINSIRGTSNQSTTGNS